MFFVRTCCLRVLSFCLFILNETWRLMNKFHNKVHGYSVLVANFDRPHFSVTDIKANCSCIDLQHLCDFFRCIQIFDVFFLKVKPSFSSHFPNSLRLNITLSHIISYLHRSLSIDVCSSFRDFVNILSMFFQFTKTIWCIAWYTYVLEIIFFSG